MFEGRHKPARPDPLAAGDGEALRPLEWSELASRLAAARELRAAVRDSAPEGEASFDAGSARWIAIHREGAAGVNPEDLGNVKGPGHKDDPVPPPSRAAPRGIE